MSTSKPETLLVGKIMKYLDTVPRCCYEKRHGDMYGNAGQPDISACIDGRRVEIEVKVPSAAAMKKNDWFVFHPVWPVILSKPQRCGDCLRSGYMCKKEWHPDGVTCSHYNPFPGNKPSVLQIERLLAWEASGAVAFIAYSVESVKYVVEKLQRGEIR